MVRFRGVDARGPIRGARSAWVDPDGVTPKKTDPDGADPKGSIQGG